MPVVLAEAPGELEYVYLLGPSPSRDRESGEAGEAEYGVQGEE